MTQKGKVMEASMKNGISFPDRFKYREITCLRKGRLWLRFPMHKIRRKTSKRFVQMERYGLDHNKES